MRYLLLLSVVAMSFISCSKSNTSDVTDPVKTPEVTAPKPIASFEITNLYNNNGDLLELRTLAFKNTSANADSYSWDLGTSANYSDGVVDHPMQFTDKAEPDNIYIAPCMQTVTIKLTAKNKAGDISTTSQSFFVQCFRGVPGGHAATHEPIHKLY